MDHDRTFEVEPVGKALVYAIFVIMSDKFEIETNLRDVVGKPRQLACFIAISLIHCKCSR